MKIKKISTISVGIAAYNAEENINKLVKSVLKQRMKKYNFEKLYIYSDASSDNTISSVKKVQDNRLIILDAKERNGFAHAFKYMLGKNSSDYMLILNDDIIIRDKYFLKKIIDSVNYNVNIGLASSMIVPIQPKGFIEKAARSGFISFQKMGTRYRNGSNIYTCDGKVLLLSNNFIRSLKFPNNLKEVGNLDAFLYIVCKQKKYLYIQAKKAIVYFKLPTTLKDFIKWQIRNLSSSKILKRKFRNLTEEEYKIPTKLFFYYKVIEFFKNPIGSIFILIVGFYCSYNINTSIKTFNSKWELINTTKKFNHV